MHINFEKVRLAAAANQASIQVRPWPAAKKAVVVAGASAVTVAPSATAPHTLKTKLADVGASLVGAAAVQTALTVCFNKSRSVQRCALYSETSLVAIQTKLRNNLPKRLYNTLEFSVTTGGVCIAVASSIWSAGWWGLLNLVAPVGGCMMGNQLAEFVAPMTNKEQLLHWLDRIVWFPDNEKERFSRPFVSLVKSGPIIVSITTQEELEEVMREVNKAAAVFDQGPLAGRARDYAPAAECVVCRHTVPDTLTLPCRHMCMCQDCFNTLSQNQIRNQTACECPICRQTVVASLCINIQPNPNINAAAAAAAAAVVLLDEDVYVPPAPAPAPAPAAAPAPAPVRVTQTVAEVPAATVPAVEPITEDAAAAAAAVRVHVDGPGPGTVTVPIVIPLAPAPARVTHAYDHDQDPGLIDMAGEEAKDLKEVPPSSLRILTATSQEMVNRCVKKDLKLKFLPPQPNMYPFWSGRCSVLDCSRTANLCFVPCGCVVVCYECVKDIIVEKSAPVNCTCLQSVKAIVLLDFPFSYNSLPGSSQIPEQ